MENKKRQTIYKTIMLIVVVSIITFVVTSIISYDGSRKYMIGGKSDKNIKQKLETAIATIKEVLDEKYIGEVDEEKLIDGALKGMVESVGDNYTEYYTRDELEDFNATTLGNFVGIGVYMQADVENNTINVISTIEDSPAEKAGIKAEDKIIKVDGIEYKADQLEEVSDHIKGEEGTEVELTILRGEEKLDIKVKRGSVHINYVDSQMLEDNIAYIYINAFDEGCKKDFLNAYNKLLEQGAKSLIIDVRYNGGGLVNEALEIADLMCDKGNVMLITVDKDEKKETTKSKTDATIKMPIVLITNQASASASEILVAALKDNGKAEVVGDKTYGKGVIQELINLSNGGALKVTSSEYYTPKEEKINKVGIEPNYKETDLQKQLEKAKEVLREKMK